MDTLRAGDKCIILAWDKHPEFVGRECIIAEPTLHDIELLVWVPILYGHVAFPVEIQGEPATICSQGNEVHWLAARQHLKKIDDGHKSWEELQKELGYTPPEKVH